MVKINKRYGGMSDLDTVAKDGEFVYSKNIITDEEKIVLGGKAKQIGSTISQRMNTSTNVTDGTNYRVFSAGNDGYGYRADTATNVLDMTSTEDIFHMTTFNDRVLWFYKGTYPNANIGIIDEDDAYSSITRQVESSYAEAWKTMASNLNNETFKTIEFGGVLYITHGKYISTLDASDVLTPDVLHTQSEIVGITSYGTRIKIFLKDGDILLRDGISSNYHSKISLKTRFISVSNVGGQDYIVSNDGMYEVQYPQYKLLKKTTEVDGTLGSEYKFDFEGPIFAYQDTVYAATSTDLYKYGKPGQMLPRTFTTLLGAVGNYNDIEITTMDVNYGTGIMYLFDNKTKYFVKYNGNMADIGELISLKYNYGVDKYIINEMKVRGYIFGDTRFAKIYYRKDNSPTWYQFGENITNMSDNTVFVLRDSLTFNNIQFLIRLEYTGATDSNTFQPTIYELDFKPILVKR